ncbi:MAG: hypothetical protein ACTSXZ_09440 [Alphaproteobacteria bacterium]
MTILHDRYEVHEKLSEGGMAEVEATEAAYPDIGMINWMGTATWFIQEDYATVITWLRRRVGPKQALNFMPSCLKTLRPSMIPLAVSNP